MDRPEDVQRNPVTGGVFIALANNSARRPAGAAGPENPAVDEANPVALTEDGEAVGNKYGHIIELREDGNDGAATGFRWQVFMVCGDPEQPFSYFAGFDKTEVSPISCPDNLMFDRAGNLWIATDGAPETIGFHDGFFAAPVEGTGRGRLKAFLTVPVGAEATGPALSEDGRSIFVAVQHPGEGGSYDEPTSTFPDGPGTKPRPSVVVVWREDGKRIGT
jgi:secreted PhoX family phosphatase